MTIHHISLVLHRFLFTSKKLLQKCKIRADPTVRDES